jgi:apolipoprotein N-acyltransferase
VPCFKPIFAQKIMSNKNGIQTIFLSLVALACFVLLSPKWLFPPAAWVAPALIVLVMNRLKPVRAFLAAWTINLLAVLISMYKVMPFPGIFFMVMAFFISLTGTIPYLINRLLAVRVTGVSTILVLPVVFVIFEYLNSFGGGGTWGSIAYTQFENLSLMQLASVTGIWGIVFLIYLSSSILVWVIENKSNENFSWRPVKTYSVIMVIVILAGTMRINSYFASPQKVVRTAAISGNNLEIVKALYEAWTGKKFAADLNSLTQTSPEVAELQKGLVAFVENPADEKFTTAKEKIIEYEDSLLALTRAEARAGAKIVAWSEALTFILREDEDRLLAKAKLLCKENKIHLLVTMAAFLPGKVEMGKKFIENKAVLINPEGAVESVLFKNKPVPVVDPSIAGDGIIPVVTTTNGNLATSICYDADFPDLMRQAGKKGADVLLLPSGDWKEIAPYHAQMAMVRGIENGFSLVRPVSGATSVVSDPYGRARGIKKFDDEGPKVLVAYVPVKGVKTFYPIIGDIVVYICGIGFVALVVNAYRNKQDR